MEKSEESKPQRGVNREEEMMQIVKEGEEERRKEAL